MSEREVRHVSVSANTTVGELKVRAQRTIELILEYGGIDGAHHKAWVIDQSLRILTGESYEMVVAEYCKGQGGPDTYEWDIGIAP